MPVEAPYVGEEGEGMESAFEGFEVGSEIEEGFVTTAEHVVAERMVRPRVELPKAVDILIAGFGDIFHSKVDCIVMPWKD